jgi:predicted nuclease of predicted toxin-antitoxin system
VRIWLDAQLSPSIASWIESSFDVDEAFAVQIDEALRSKKDREIFERARQVGAVVMTKDHDFVELLDRLGPPPQVLWVTCGNTSNRVMRRILSKAMPDALALLRQGEPLVEISDLE